MLARRFAPWRPEFAASPGGEETRDAGRPVGVHPDAADRVVGGGADGDPVARQVEPVGAAGGGDAREASRDALGVEVGEHEVDAPHVRALEVAHDRPRDLVARGELGLGQGRP